MKLARIRQLEKFVRGLQGDGYDVNIFVSRSQKRLIVHISLSLEEGEEIMARWNDLRRVE